jgi:hypothetical protein
VVSHRRNLKQPNSKKQSTEQRLPEVRQTQGVMGEVVVKEYKVLGLEI